MSKKLSLEQSYLTTSQKVHELIKSGITPKAEYSSKCKKCSLYEQCMPKVSGKARSVSNYLLTAMEE